MKRRTAEKGAEGKRKLSDSDLDLRHFSDGGALGAEDFVEGVFAMARSRFGPTRRGGARRILQAATPLRTLRGVRKDAITV